LVPSRGIREPAFFGFKIKLDLSPHIDRMAYLGCYARELRGMLRRFLVAGMTVIDAGANIGDLTALSVMSVGPGGTAISIEPNRKAFAHLRTATILNKVKCLRTALPDRPASVRLSTLQHGNHENDSIAETAAMDRCDFETVLADTLDIACRPRLIRIDQAEVFVAGSELKAVIGSRELSRDRHIRALSVVLSGYWRAEHGTSD
jgi:FkbM family methyltransferase